MDSKECNPSLSTEANYFRYSGHIGNNERLENRFRRLLWGYPHLLSEFYRDWRPALADMCSREKAYDKKRREISVHHVEERDAIHIATDGDCKEHTSNPLRPPSDVIAGSGGVD